MDWKPIVEAFGTVTKVAQVCEAGRPLIHWYMKKQRPPKAIWAVRLEEASGGKIARGDLRPDLKGVW